MTEEQKKTLAFAIYALANYDIPMGEFLERSLLCIDDTLKQGQTLPIDSVVQSCDTCKHLSTCRFWQEAPNNGATCKFYIEHVA
tara:strand:+ start:51 stop:302 length:252 start_codon:yes stop_codon:yes gene_type:complete